MGEGNDVMSEFEERFFGWKKINQYLDKEKILFVPHKNQKFIPRHGHDFLEISYIDRGTVGHTLNGQETVLRQGDYVIVCSVPNCLIPHLRAFIHFGA